MAQGKSNVWKFFKICNDDEKKAECSLCESTSQKQKQIIRGKTPKLFSTKPLWNHLKSKHPLAIKTLDREINVNKDEDDPPTSGPSFTITSKSEPYQTQPTLQSVIKKKEMWSLDDSRSMNITKKICMFYFYIYYRESLSRQHKVQNRDIRRLMFRFWTLYCLSMYFIINKYLY